MKTNRLYPWTPVLVLAPLFLAFAFLPALAQNEDAAEETDFNKFLFEFETWVAQPAGLDYFPATEMDPEDPYNTQLLTFPTGTESRFRYRGGFDFGRNYGGFVVTWYSHESESEITQSSPGNYVFGEILAYPLLAGYYNDGLADGFDSSAKTTLRDLRIDYYRTAFKTARMEAKWFVGWRRVTFQRELEANYYALINDLPPLTSNPALVPGVDAASLESDYNGRGVEAGMDFLMPLWKNKLQAEGGFNLAVLRGKTDASYSSTNWYYTVFLDPDTYIIAPPYDFDGYIGDTPVINYISQEAAGIGLVAESLSSTGNVLEAYVGLRWMAWRGLEVFGGFRSTRYDDVGVDLRPKTSGYYAGLNVEDVTENDRSATYEGFYAGLAYRF